MNTCPGRHRASFAQAVAAARGIASRVGRKVPANRSMLHPPGRGGKPPQAAACFTSAWRSESGLSASCALVERHMNIRLYLSIRLYQSIRL
eukprot:360715-Chlamydomonas_euryale.AAC.5